MSGKNLTFKLVMDADVKNYVSNIKQSESVTKSVLTTIKAESDRLKSASSGAAEGLNALSNEARSTAQHVSTLDQAIGQTNTELAQTATASSRLQAGLGGLRTGVTALAGALAAVGVGLTAQQLAQTVDTYTNLSTQVRLATEDNGNFEEAMAGVHQVALATNSSLDSTAMLFARVNDAGKEMGYTQQQTLQLTKTITQAIQAGGGSAQAAQDALQQFIQALQGGVLRGEEFNSMMEGAPGLAKAMAQSFGVTTGELRKMAENGELTSEKVLKAVESMSGKVQATYDKMPMTIGNALQRIKTQWEILIGTMDQSNGASATVAQWMATIADNMTVVETLIKDIGQGFIWVGDQLKKIDPATIEELKTALSGAYETVKSFGTVLAGAFERGIDLTNTALSTMFNFSSGVDAAGDKTNGFTKFLQALNVAIGFLGDGFNAINIVMDLFVGALYSAGSAWEGLKANFTFGDVRDQAIANMTAMQAKAEEYYKKASDGALNFESQGKKAWEEIGKSQEQKQADSLKNSEATLSELIRQEQEHAASYQAISDERLKLEQQLYEARKTGNQASIDLAIKGLSELDTKEKEYQAESKKITDEKIVAAQQYVDSMMTMSESTSKVISKEKEAYLAAQGLKVEFDSAGKAIVKAMDEGSVAIANTNVALNKAKAGAAALGIDIDISLNRVSKKFSETESSLDNFVAGLEDMGATGQQAADLTYQGWLKWLETAKSQAEIDFAKAKLKEFGDQGQISTSQVEQGLIAIKLQAQELPDDIDPVTEAFKRLGIQTKEQLKLSAQQALMDYITIRDSGKATAEGIQKAYEKAAQSAAASGDAGVIAATNAANAGRNLEIQIDETGKAAVKSNDEWDKSNHRVRDSARDIGDGYRHAGQIAREEAESSTEAWNKALEAVNGAMHATRTGERAKMANNVDDIEAQLKAQGYSDAKAKELAKGIYEGSKSGNGYKQMGNNWSFAGGGGGMSNTEYVNAELKRLQQYANSSNVNSLAPNVNANLPTPPDTSSGIQNTTRIELALGNQTATVYGNQSSVSTLESIINQLKTQAKST